MTRSMEDVRAAAATAAATATAANAAANAAATVAATEHHSTASYNYTPDGRRRSRKHHRECTVVLI